MIYALVGLAAALLFAALLVRWGTRWGSTPEERAQTMPGDEFLEGGPRARVAMTRAVSLTAPPERVWPWIAQLGRGAGWYSVDRLDNGGRRSAWHIVSWIPEPRLGDATAVGYVRHLEPGRSIAWWSDGVRFLGANARLVVCYEVRAEGEGARLVSRMSADATGVTSRPMLHVFRAMDSIMACSQLIGLRERIESWERDDPRREEPETGARDQYQVYDVLYADGGRAGVEGKETGAKWRAAAIRDGVLDEPS
ncbi:MAG: hypothetical protein QNJ90_02020 [Planctomycetota bacterium]|nr:hypothetical protein [Planctomycetota bacterium]